MLINLVFGRVWSSVPSGMMIQQFVCPHESRHIEIQVFGDKHGNYVAFPERECSIQRRNQKVIEESPSTLLSPATRKLMQDQAVMLAAKVGYVGAGTVEFIADNDQNFYFLEMNTRLQVEHPVTEMVSGYDLVEWQLKVAAGEPLPATQDEVQANGWSFEARVYAEDPINNFRPGSGPLLYMKRPETSSTVRVDSGVVQGEQCDVYGVRVLLAFSCRAHRRTYCWANRHSGGAWTSALSH